jgi:hypothetical protein
MHRSKMLAATGGYGRRGRANEPQKNHGASRRDEVVIAGLGQSHSISEVTAQAVFFEIVFSTPDATIFAAAFADASCRDLNSTIIILSLRRDRLSAANALIVHRFINKTRKIKSIRARINTPSNDRFHCFCPKMRHISSCLSV